MLSPLAYRRWKPLTETPRLPKVGAFGAEAVNTGEAGLSIGSGRPVRINAPR
jgi:hypothetical protein